MKLKDIPGQITVKNELHQLVKEKRLPHAIYFYGPSGNAKLSLTLWLTQALLCTADPEENCEKCPCCHKISKYIHPDVHFLYPSYLKKADKSSYEEFTQDWRSAIGSNQFLDIDEWMSLIGGQSKTPNISAADCRRVIQKLSMRSFEGRSKILIIWMAQYLGNDGNRLLKLIEEPPEDTYLILLGDSVDSVLPTIRSRCLTMHIPSFADTEVVEYLIQKENVDSNNSQWIATIAEGNMSEAIRMSSNNTGHIPDLWIEWLRHGIRWSESDYVNWNERFGRLPRLDQRTFFKYGIAFMRRLLLAKVIGYKEDSRDQKALEVLTKKLSTENIGTLVGLCNGYLTDLEKYANPGIIMMHAGIQLKNILQSVPVTSYKMT